MPETDYIEYKREWKDDFLRVICAFANSEGGKLFVGKNDEGESVGIDNAIELLETLPNKINARLGIIVSKSVHECSPNICFLVTQIVLSFQTNQV